MIRRQPHNQAPAQLATRIQADAARVTGVHPCTPTQRRDVARYERAMRAYGCVACLGAFLAHMKGEGASTVARTCSYVPAGCTTRQADAAINAGRYMVDVLGVTTIEQARQLDGRNADDSSSGVDDGEMDSLHR